MQRPVDALLYLTLVTALAAVLSAPQNGTETSGGEVTAGPLSNATTLGLTSDAAAPATQEDPSTAFPTSELHKSSPTSPTPAADDYTGLTDGATSPGPSPGATRTTTAAAAAAAPSSPPGNRGGHPSPEKCMFERKQGLILLMVAGALTVACVGLLVTAAVLACKVCQRRRDGGRDQDLISNSEYWMGSVQRSKAQRRYDDAPKENCLLLGALEIKGEGEQGGGGGSGGGGGDGGVSSGGEAADKKKKEEETGGEKEVTEAGDAVGSDPVPAPRGNGRADGVASAGPA